MKWLLEMDPNEKTKSRIDVYKKKQEEYTEAFERKTKAFNDALKRSMDNPINDTIEKQRAEYDVWVSENQKTYNNFVQAAYMDWVTTGRKEEVEYYFAIVDNDSAMSRVEASKVRTSYSYLVLFVEPFVFFRLLCALLSSATLTVPLSTPRSNSPHRTGMFAQHIGWLSSI